MAASVTFLVAGGVSRNIQRNIMEAVDYLVLK